VGPEREKVSLKRLSCNCGDERKKIHCQKGVGKENHSKKGIAFFNPPYVHEKVLCAKSKASGGGMAGTKKQKVPALHKGH